jgi:histidyl-tRNA synthetase
MRILDSKDAGDKVVVAGAPVIAPFLTEHAASFYAKLQDHLARMGVPYRENPRIVRGLDYYSHTAFEFVTDALGAQGTVMGGGRYDGLVEEMGGPPTPAVGWAAGIERLSMLLAQGPGTVAPVTVIPTGEDAEAVGVDAVQLLRHAGIRAEIGYRGNLKRRMERANKQGARAAVIIGSDEAARGVAQVKNLTTGEQHEVALTDLATHLA